jgi:hypothetical protein
MLLNPDKHWGMEVFNPSLPLKSQKRDEFISRAEKYSGNERKFTKRML